VEDYHYCGVVGHVDVDGVFVEVVYWDSFFLEVFFDCVKGFHLMVLGWRIFSM